MKYLAMTAAIVVGILLAGGPAQVVRAQEEEQAPATKPAKATPVDFRKLKAWLPAEVAGIKREDATGEKMSIGEFVVTQASGNYSAQNEDGEGASADVTVIDYGANPEMVEGMASWAQLEFDRETDSGYERTRTIGEYPAMETWDGEGKAGTLHVLVAKRFYVTLDAREVTAEQWTKAVEGLPLKALGELK